MFLTDCEFVLCENCVYFAQIFLQVFISESEEDQVSLRHGSSHHLNKSCRQTNQSIDQ